MRRALLAWGLGHLAVGDRRGWLLLGLEAVWLAALGASLLLLDTDLWLLSFALLTGFLVIWAAQAVTAHRIAVRRAGHGGGAVQIAFLLPIVMLSVTSFWLVGGSTASPGATLQRYVSAWEHGRPEAAAPLFATPHDPAAVGVALARDTKTVADRVAAFAAVHPDWDLDAQRPFTNLHFEYRDDLSVDANAVSLAIQVVRLAREPTTFFGLVPATRSETRVVAVIGEVRVVRVAAETWLPGASVWRMESVALQP